MTIAVTRLDPESYGRTPWKNGGGILVDIADAYRDDGSPHDWNSLLWRFGRTAITIPAPFSHLPDLDRMQMVVEGRGLILKAADRDYDEREPFKSVRFPGELEIVTQLEAGPVEVVNLMARRGAVEIDLRALTEPGAVTLPAGTHLIYAPAGRSLVRIEETAHPLAGNGTLRADLASAARLTLVSGLVVVGSIYPK